jgi:putative Mg2+ transporter-C (MgtC) family protein
MGETLGKLGLSLVLGGLIGLEREAHQRPAGFRTHIIVCLGACLFMLVSLKMGELDPNGADPSRVASQVVPGIGFLGAGTILKTGLTVKGLTTAAGLWTAAAIGLAVGAGYWTAALGATALTLVAIFPLGILEKRMSGDVRRLSLRAKDASGLLAKIDETLRAAKAEVKGIDVHHDPEGVEVLIRVSKPGDDLIRRLRELPDVERVEET